MEEYDFYGFKLKHLSSQQVEARARCLAQENKQTKAWEKYVKKNRTPSEDTCKKLCRKGIPPEARPLQWFVISGAARRAASKDRMYYRQMVEIGRNSSDYNQIDIDLARTFPDNIWLRTEEAHNMLRRVLLAYSMHNPSVGYCQGLNYLAGMLLLVLQKHEERAFWILVSLLDEGILYEDMFSRNLVGVHVEMQSLAELVAEKMPKLAHHLGTLQCDITIVATDWFLCLFCTSLPSETAMRVWDSLLCEGPKILYRVALALLKTNEEPIMKLNDAGNVLRHLRAANATIHDRDALMTLAFEHVGSMPMATIEAHRKEKQKVIAANLRQRTSKSNLKKAISRGASVNDSSGSGFDAAANDVLKARQMPDAIRRQYSTNSGGYDGRHEPQRQRDPYASPAASDARYPSTRSKSGGFNLFSGGNPRDAPHYDSGPSHAREENLGDSMITIKDVTQSSRGSFAGTIVSQGRDNKLIMSPEYVQR